MKVYDLVDGKVIIRQDGSRGIRQKGTLSAPDFDMDNWPYGIECCPRRKSWPPIPNSMNQLRVELEEEPHP